MKKMFLYDSEGYEVIACQLMEESRCGEPQLVVVTPGKPVTSLETFMDDTDTKEMLFLCEDGETVPSKRVVRMLSPLIKDQDETPMTDLIHEMDKLGIKRSKDPVSIFMIAYKSNDPDDDKTYNLSVFLDDNEMPIRLKKSFYSLDILLESLTFFHHAIIEEAEIDLSIRIHFLGTNKDEVPESVRYMFDKIHFSHEK